MEKEVKQEGFIKRWGGISSLFAIAAVLVVLIVRIESIPVIERRLDKKIEQLNEHEEALNQHEIEFLIYQLEHASKEIERIKELKHLEIEIAILKEKLKD